MLLNVAEIAECHVPMLIFVAATISDGCTEATHLQLLCCFYEVVARCLDLSFPTCRVDSRYIA